MLTKIHTDIRKHLVTLFKCKLFLLILLNRLNKCFDNLSNSDSHVTIFITINKIYIISNYR